MYRAFAVLGAFILIAGCGELKDLPTAPVDPNPPDPSATFARVSQQVLTPSCTQIGCHDSLGRSEQLILEQGVAWGNLVGRPSVQRPTLLRVTPGDPDRSYLFLKLTAAPGIVGSPMPLSQPRLPDAQIALVRDWIRRGAPND